MSFKVAKPSEYLVITGAKIPDIKLARKSWVWPGQRCVRINVSPINYSVDIHAMSSEKLSFLLPTVFTIGPHTGDLDSLLKYAKLMPTPKTLKTHVDDLVRGIIHGQTRVIAASMTIEEIFKGTKVFKQQVFEKVQLELNPFGLFIYNANVKELMDSDGNQYFYHLGKKIEIETGYSARQAYAEADMKVKMGAKYREAKVLQSAAKLDAEMRIFFAQQTGEGEKEEVWTRTEAKVLENSLDGDAIEAASKFEERKTISSGRAAKVRIETEKANAIRGAELQLELEKKTVLVGLQKLRSELLNKATIESEAKIQEANSKFFQQQKNIDAFFYAEQKDAEVKKMLADVELYAKKREAEALMTMTDAHAYHVHQMLNALRGNYNALRDYMMINNNMYKEIAKMSVESVNVVKQNMYCVEGSGILKTMLQPLLERVLEQTEMVSVPWLLQRRDREGESNDKDTTASANTSCGSVAPSSM